MIATAAAHTPSEVMGWLFKYAMEQHAGGVGGAGVDPGGGGAGAGDVGGDSVTLVGGVPRGGGVSCGRFGGGGDCGRFGGGGDCGRMGGGEGNGRV